MSDDGRASIREIREVLPDEKQNLRMAELVDERADFIGLREDFIQRMAREIRNATEGNCASKDLLALTTNSDPFYVMGRQVEQAGWYGEIDAAEGEPERHPRKMHYSILDEYDDRHGERYVGDSNQWDELKEAARYAALLGSVDPQRREDGKNNDPKGIQLRGVEQSPDWDPHWNIRTNYSGASAGSTISNPSLIGDFDRIIERNVNAVVSAVFDGVQFSGERRQPVHAEVWGEKGGIIPSDLRREHGVATRPAAGGEPSSKMCEEAVRIADERDQSLVVVMLADFDEKGRDMPQSVARKIEAEASLKDVEAHVFHAGLTKEQVQTLDLSFAPGTVPDGADRGSTGAKAVQTQQDSFAAFAGEEGRIEVNALANDHPDVLRESIVECIEPFRDDSLGERLDQAVEAERDRFEEAVAEQFGDDDNGIENVYQDLEDGVEAFDERVEADGEIEETEDEIADIEDEIQRLQEERDELADELEDRMRQIRDDIGLTEKRRTFHDALDLDLSDTLSEFDLDLPEPEIERRDDAILDTRRSWVEQLSAYREFNYRMEVGE